jgi:hypothetical protein
MIFPIAHAGHWAADLLYVAPLLIALGVLGVQSMKERRKVRRGEAEPRRPPTAGPPRTPRPPA